MFSSFKLKKKNPDAAAYARKESFLARYPRKHKMAALAVILLVLVTLGFMGGPEVVPEQAREMQAKVAVEGTDQGGIQIEGSNPSETPAADAASNAADASLNEQDSKSVKLTPAPALGITEDTAEGSLPRISEDGRQPWQVYARPFNTADKRPRVAIVITDLGLSRVATDAAINRMPANVTLAFDSQSPIVGAWIARARQDGHETLMMVPMEPFDYPRSDPGINTLLTNLPNTDNLVRLNWALRQGTGYVGITSPGGSRFTTAPEKLATVLDVLKKRGLMILDARAAPHSAIMDMAHDLHIPAAVATVRIDQNPSPEAIDQALEQLVKTARLTGRAVGISSPLPVVIDRLEPWLRTLPGQGIALAPISTMTK